MKFNELTDLAASRLGGEVLFANDEFFAPKRNLLKPEAPIFIPDKYTSRGKWMDGWETRRCRQPAFDWCVIKLGLRGIVRGVTVDTSHFAGNYPEHCSIEALDLHGNAGKRWAEEDAPWTEILQKSPLQGGSQNTMPVRSELPWSHLRLKIYPDGGVARLRVHGEVVPDWDSLRRRKGLLDLAAVENGGMAVLGSDMYFGHRNNLIMPGRSKNMGDGWETKRRRGPGHDWVILRLGAPGALEKIEVDTSHFKGNYPDSCSMDGATVWGPSPEALTSAPVPIEWEEILPKTKLKPHARHQFTDLKTTKPFNHVRFHIYPDGGVARLRLYGRPAKA